MFLGLKKTAFFCGLSTAVFVIINCYNHPVYAITSRIPVEGNVYEDDLNTVNGTRWGGERNWAFSKFLEIRESLVESIVGRVVMDRHGTESGFSLFSPFDSPHPSRLIFVSLWASKFEGCFLEFIVQHAPTRRIDPKSVVPVEIEVGIGNQIVAFNVRTGNALGFSSDYTYSDCSGDDCVDRRSTWYSGRQVFVFDESIARILRNAPEREVRARVVLADGSSQIYPIGVETVRRWSNIYSFNPSCQNPF